MILFLLAINHLSIVFNHPRAADFDAPSVEGCLEVSSPIRRLLRLIRCFKSRSAQAHD
jgi:hypothetical protein